MEQYFTAIQPHLEDKVDISATPQKSNQHSSKIVTLGTDNLIYIKDLSSQQQDRKYLSQGHGYNAISLASNNQNCYLGGQSGSVDLFNLQTQQKKTVYNMGSKISSLNSSSSGKYISICSQQSKCVILQTESYNWAKCRPGHEDSVIYSFFSDDEKFIASIGLDKNLLIYSMEQFQQPQEVYRFKISKNEGKNYVGSFHKFLPIVYSPGSQQLQIIELLNSKWQIRKSKFIKHSNIIQLAATIKQCILITSCLENTLIWNNKNEQKLVVIQNFNLVKIVQINNTFFGVKADGKIYQYKRYINQNIYQNNEPQKMEIEQQKPDTLVFDDQAEQDQNDQKQQEQEDISVQEKEYHQAKKSKADQLIKTYPQDAIKTSTSIFQGARFLGVNVHGYIIQRREMTQNQQKQTVIIQYEDMNDKKRILFTDKEIQFVDFNQDFMTYANQTTFGCKFFDSSNQDFKSWQKNWWDISAIAMTNQWIAVANEQEIKIYDLTGNELKNICFDRLIIGLAVYENLLVVVFHQTIPMLQNQCLAMQIFVINHYSFQTIPFTSTHVPVRPKSILRYFRFTEEGMLLTQDSQGFLRAYNLQLNTWSSLIVEAIDDMRRLYIIGMKDYKLVYWKTTAIQPDPIVFPKLTVKQSLVGINVCHEDVEQLKNYSYLLFERYSLDHQKCRNRLWGHLKQGRSNSNKSYKISSTILNQKLQKQRHYQLDQKFMDIIVYYLQAKQLRKAINSAKSFLRTIQAGRQIEDLFDRANLRTLAVQLQYFNDEKLKELDYQKMQTYEFTQMKQEAEKIVKPRAAQNPMNPMKKKVNKQSIPSILNTSQLSQSSNFDMMSQKSKNARENIVHMQNIVPQQFQIPFLKKKPTGQDMQNKKKQIQDQVQKFGIKKKADKMRKL